MLQGKYSAIRSTFIKLSFVIKIFVLSIFEWPFFTGLLHLTLYALIDRYIKLVAVHCICRGVTGYTLNLVRSTVYVEGYRLYNKLGAVHCICRGVTGYILNLVRFTVYVEGYRLYIKLGAVHCICRGFKGYNFQIKLYFYL